MKLTSERYSSPIRPNNDQTLVFVLFSIQPPLKDQLYTMSYVNKYV